jgi:hypothetical protein
MLSPWGWKHNQIYTKNNPKSYGHIFAHTCKKVHLKYNFQSLSKFKLLQCSKSSSKLFKFLICGMVLKNVFIVKIRYVITFILEVVSSYVNLK